MPRLLLRYRSTYKGKPTGPYLVYADHKDSRGQERFYGRVCSSDRKQGETELVEIIKREISRQGFYDPETIDEWPTADVS